MVKMAVMATKAAAVLRKTKIKKKQM